MKAITLILCALAFGACGSDCGTSDSGCKDYLGDQSASAPYSDTPTIEVVHLDAFSQIYAKVWVHNPTNQERTADVSCTFWIGDWEDVDNPSTREVAVCPDSSVEASLVWGGDLMGATEVGADCEVVWQ